MNNSALLSVWVRQQTELGMPDPVLPGAAEFMRSLRNPEHYAPLSKSAGGTALNTAGRPSAAARAASSNPFSRLQKLAPLAKTHAAAPSSDPAVETEPPVDGPAQGMALPIDGPLTFEQKRTLFKGLYAARCDKCPLARGRKSFVFGSGNVDAALMIIGEAPGAEEDAQGLPFVGQAGRLLTEMLAAISLDRKKDVFITNILKCRPPSNRTPESAEILACLPLLEKQIAIVRPRLLLLLGRIAAHSVLALGDSISKMRGNTHSYKGIPAVVTYHPAAILRNPEYRGPADEDFQKTATMLKESRHHGDS
jgi:DNA polymerase